LWRPHKPELAFQFLVAEFGNPDRPAIRGALDPAEIKEAVGEGRSKSAGEMVSAFTPIDALTCENSSRFLSRSSLRKVGLRSRNHVRHQLEQFGDPGYL
jgi:hypothetical protein